MISLLNVDCMEYMATLPEKAFDLAICDPPYGHSNHLIRKGNTRSKIATAKRFKHYDNSAPLPPEYFIELKSVSIHQIIWGANHFCDRFNAAGSAWLVWDKQTSGHFSDCELAYSSFGTACRKFTYLWNGMHQGSTGGDVRRNEEKIHPTQKPVALYKWLLDQFAKPGQRILDTHLGSGSSAIAAHYFGCEFVGCEVDPDFYQATCERFKNATAQQAFCFA